MDHESVAHPGKLPLTPRYLVVALACGAGWFGVLMAHPLTRAMVWEGAFVASAGWPMRLSNVLVVVAVGVGTAVVLRHQLRSGGVIMALVNGLRLFVIGAVGSGLLIGASTLILGPGDVTLAQAASLPLLMMLYAPLLLLLMGWWYVLPLAALTAFVLHKSLEAQPAQRRGEVSTTPAA